MNLTGELLDRAARATPAAVEDRGSGWWIRHTDGNAWWSGAVLAHGAPDDGCLSERIDAAEHFYAERDALARLQVCPGCPPDLDRMLADRGYRRDAPISLQTMDPSLDMTRQAAGQRARTRQLAVTPLPEADDRGHKSWRVPPGGGLSGVVHIFERRADDADG